MQCCVRWCKDIFWPTMEIKELVLCHPLKKEISTTSLHVRADDSAVKLLRECCGFALCLDRFHVGATKQYLSSHKDGDISQFKTKHLLFESHRTAACGAHAFFFSFSTKLKNISTAERNARRESQACVYEGESMQGNNAAAQREAQRSRLTRLVWNGMCFSGWTWFLFVWRHSVASAQWRMLKWEFDPLSKPKKKETFIDIHRPTAWAIINWA